jgi:hypothetical protein
VNLAIAQAEVFRVTRASRVLQFASWGFDAAVSEWVMALGSGACLVLANEAELHDPVQLQKLCERFGVTHATLPPALLQLLDPRNFGCIESLIVAGERCPTELARRWCVGRRFFNAYGPAEAAVCATIAEFKGERELNIGQPMANVQCVILDRFGEIMPQGALGELCIGGMGLTRGYHRRPDLDQDRFLLLSAPELPDARLLRTGDLASMGEDGAFQFHGRLDDQISLNGHRIEPTEIEAALKSSGLVRNAAVVCRRVKEANLLIAFVVHHPQLAAAGLDALRARLRDVLPRFMQPHIYVEIGEIPLTPNGKIDREHLRSREISEREPENAAPGDPVECRIFDIWRALLPGESPGVEDNFFSLGGDSMAAMLVMARVNAEFAASLDIGVFLRSPTIKALAAAVQSESSHANRAEAPSGETFPLSPAQRRLWAREQSGLEASNTISSAFRLFGCVDYDAFSKALAAVAQRHEVLRTHIARERGAPVQRVMGVDEIALPLRRAPLHEPIEQRLTTDAVMPLHTESGLLWRVHWYGSADEMEAVVLLVMHHLISDAWSSGIFFNDLLRAYAQAVATGRVDMPPLRSAYRDYARWCSDMLAGDAAQSLRAYWRVQMSGATLRSRIPLDRAPRPGHAPAPKLLELSLDVERTQRLAAWARAAAVSEYAVVLTGMYELIRAETGDSDVTLLTPVNGRVTADHAEQLGYFVNLLPLRLAVDADFDSAARVRHVAAVVGQMLTHRHYPLEDILRLMEASSSAAVNETVGFTWNVASPPSAPPDLPLELEEIRLPPVRLRSPIWFYGSRSAANLTFAAEFDGTLFSDARVHSLLARLALSIERICSMPTTAAAPHALEPADDAADFDFSER